MTKASDPSRESATIELGLITGVSQYNPRTIDANGIDELGASLLASGQLQPLLVTIEDESYAVLDGQRRWQAMCRLAEEGHWTLQHPVAVELLHLPEPALREIGLAANTMRRQLHPVEEYRAFDALARAGVGEEQIVADFGLGLRHVRQRLALGRLAPKILDAWLEGKINAEAAQAFTICDSPSAQESAFDTLTSKHQVTPYAIRKALQSNALPGDCREAKYVGAGAYISAGGAIREDLFDDEVLFLDGALLQKLAKEKLLAEGNAIADREGWGFVGIEGQSKFSDFDIDRTPPAYLPDEEERLVELNDILENSKENDTEIEELESRAYLRAVPAEKRNRMGIFLGLYNSGLPLVTRGLVQKQSFSTDEKTESAPFAVGGASKGAAAVSSPAAAPASQDLSKTARQILDVAIEDGFYTAIRTRPDIAIMLAVAALGCKCTAFDRLIDLERAPNEPRDGYKSYLLQKIGKLDFATALGLCKHADVSDLSSAFAELVASSILRPHSLDDMDPLAAAICTRGAALDEALTRAIDYEEYFNTMSKSALADFADAAGDPGIKRSAAKKTLAAQLSSLARKNGWLPEPLKTWALMTPRETAAPAAVAETPLAQAMDEAISADEAAKTTDVSPPQKKKRGRKKQAETFQ